MFGESPFLFLLLRKHFVDHRITEARNTDDFRFCETMRVKKLDVWPPLFWTHRSQAVKRFAAE